MAKKPDPSDSDPPEPPKPALSGPDPSDSAENAASRVRSEPAAASVSGRTSYDSAKLRFVGACGAIAAGLAIAGSLDRSTGGVLVLVGWIGAVATLHRLGRAGSRA